MEARYTSSGPRGVGTTAELVYPKQTLSLRVLEYEENRKLTLQFTSGPIKGTKTTFIFETADGKTRVTRMDDVKATGFYRLLGIMVTRQVKKVGTDDLANTKRAMESEQRSQVPMKVET